MSDIGIVSDHPLEEKPVSANDIVRSELSRFSGWYGVWCIIATEGSLFAYLFFSYFYALAQSPQYWPVSGPPSLLVPLLITVALVASSAALVTSQWQIFDSAQVPRIGISFAVAVLCGLIGLGLQAYDLQQKAPLISKSAYDSYYVLVATLDILHAAAGVIALIAVFLWFREGLILGPRRSYLSIVAAYWHFTVIVWLCVFAAFVLQPHMR